MFPKPTDMEMQERRNSMGLSQVCRSGSGSSWNCFRVFKLVEEDTDKSVFGQHSDFDQLVQFNV